MIAIAIVMTTTNVTNIRMIIDYQHASFSHLLGSPNPILSTVLAVVYRQLLSTPLQTVIITIITIIATVITINHCFQRQLVRTLQESQMLSHVIVFLVGLVISPHYSDQMSHWSKVSVVTRL